MKGAIGWLLVAAGSAVIIIGSALCVAGCNLTPAQDARIARAWVTAACVTVDTLDPALEQNNLVELLCPPSPPSVSTADASSTPAVTVVFQRVVVSKAAWRDTLHGTQVISAPLDAGAGG